MSKVLFICKQGNDERIHAYGYFRKFSGLFNSARLVNDMLNQASVPSQIEIARDNNDIDRLVTKHKPDYCIIEAYWVVPEKFEVLTKLHPHVKWIIRIHSEVPFWAMEGVSMDWSLRYLDYKNVYLAPNAVRVFKDLQTALSVKYTYEEYRDRIVFLPNFYPAEKRATRKKHKGDTIHIACFGAVRPLKNHLTQALAAIEFANRHGFKLVFHINGNRIEGGGDPILRNLRLLFSHATKHELVEHAWQPHAEFLDVIAQMDMGLQVSFTESFNIVAADMVTMDVPMVTSKEVHWISRLFYADPTCTRSIVCAMERAYLLGRVGAFLNRIKLAWHSANAAELWISYFGGKQWWNRNR